MKLYHDSKKLCNTFLFLASLLFLFGPFLSVSALTVQDLQNKINSKDADIARLEEEIKSYQTELDGLEKQKKSLNVAIKELDLTRKKLGADIGVTQKKIDKTSLKIQGLNSDIRGKEEDIGVGVDAISLGIRHANEIEQKNILEIMLSQEDFTTVWNEINSIAAVGEQMRESVSQLRKIKGELEDTREETTLAKAELTRLKSKLSDQEKIVAQNQNEKNRLLKQTKNSEANYQKLLKERIAQRDAFEQELRDFEAQLQFILDPSKLPSSRVLSWPLENIYVTQLFGRTAAAKRLYASGSHSGVDFKASIGTPVKAMASGVVLGTGDTDLVCPGASFGRWVFIKHHNGLSSVYGHLSLIKASVGQNVLLGDVIGYSGNTGHTTGPHLHVGVYASDGVNIISRVSAKSCAGRIFTMPYAALSAYLNPLDFLPPYPYTAEMIKPDL